MWELSSFDLTPANAKGREWLLANNLGGYSSSTAIGMNTRKYHGLLVAQAGRLGRHVMLSKLEETARAANSEFPLSTNTYPGTVFPEGYRHLVGFSFGRHPTFTYSLGGARLEKSVRMVRGKNTVVVSYRLKSGRSAELSIRPLLCPRQIHSDPSPHPSQPDFGFDRRGFSIKKPAQMRMSCSDGKFSFEPLRYSNMEYRTEMERGYPFTETLYSPGVFSASLVTGEELHLCCSLEGMAPSEALYSLDSQEARMAHLSREYEQSSGVGRTDFSEALLAACDSFCTMREGRAGIAAGYHWFSEWGRDAMISLPGLLLATGRHSFAREVLMAHAARMRGGVLPNFLDESGEAHFGSSDASLWFLNALSEYERHTGDLGFAAKGMWRYAKAALHSYIDGNGLAEMDSDCLISVKEPASTWMDAKIGGKAVTPRKGKPVEINALWYSSLKFMAEAAGRAGDRRTARLAEETAEAACASFQKFLSADDGRLFDVIEPADPSVRPNQVFAVSLPHSPLNGIQKKHVLSVVRSRLYTPLGLHSLAPGEPRFHEYYRGNQSQRDEAYHQGAIWPWLLGPFYDAQMSVYPGSERQVLSSLRIVFEAMKGGCIGTLPELYEPATMAPAGAVSQAWSVAEIMRIYTKVKKAGAHPSQHAEGVRGSMRIREA